jgi:trigger factor
LVGRNLVIREAARKILVDIVFEVPNRIIIKRGRFLRNGVEVIVTPDYTRVVNNGHQYSGLKFTNRSGGIFIGHHSYPFVAAIYIENIHRPQVQLRRIKRTKEKFKYEFEQTDSVS